MKLYENIKKLVQYGIDCGITPECERVYTTNLLLDAFGVYRNQLIFPWPL